MIKLGSYKQNINGDAQMPIEWETINSSNGNFLISANILDIQQFNSVRAIVDFNSSTLKAWLERVLCANFSEEERAKIKRICIPTKDIIFNSTINLSGKTQYASRLNCVIEEDFFWVDSDKESDMQTIAYTGTNGLISFPVGVESFVGVRIMLELNSDEENVGYELEGVNTGDLQCADSINMEQRQIFNGLFAKDFEECIKEIRIIALKGRDYNANTIAGKRIHAQQELGKFAEQEVEKFEKRITSHIETLAEKSVELIKKQLAYDFLAMLQKHLTAIKNINEKKWSVLELRQQISYQKEIKTYFSKLLKKVGIR